jgi:hypothetical protein
MNYEKMWNELKDIMKNLSPHYGELNNKGVLYFMDKIKNEKKLKELLNGITEENRHEEQIKDIQGKELI